MKFGSQLQTNWDWRAACNFMFGGTGSALILVMVLFSWPQTVPIELTLAALAFVGLGLFMVWLEIGRPRRFLHVFYHPNTSWMTREASAGSVLFPVTIAGALFESVSLMCLAALLGLVFLYCQARILKAARGVPAWRTPAIVPLVMSSGLVEGCSITVGYAYLVGAQTASMAPLLIALLLVRGWAWFAYRDLLQREPAPAGALQALDKTNRYFMVIGIVAPLLFCCLAIADIVATISVAVACLIATSAGWLLKFDIVVKAAFKQGYGIGKLRKGRPVITAPVRRKGDPIQY